MHYATGVCVKFQLKCYIATRSNNDVEISVLKSTHKSAVDYTEPLYQAYGFLLFIKCR